MRVYSIFSCGFDYVTVILTSSFLSTNAITTSVRLKNTKSVVTQTLATTSLLQRSRQLSFS